MPLSFKIILVKSSPFIQPLKQFIDAHKNSGFNREKTPFEDTC